MQVMDRASTHFCYNRQMLDDQSSNTDDTLET